MQKEELYSIIQAATKMGDSEHIRVGAKSKDDDMQLIHLRRRYQTNVMSTDFRIPA